MPIKPIKLLENAKKSVNKLWSEDLVQRYHQDLVEHLTKHPTEVSNPEVVALKSIINQKLRENRTRFLFEHLPREYPDILIHLNIPYVVHQPKLPTMSSIPAPQPFKTNFDTWVNSVELYFLVTAVTDESKKKNLFLYLLGSENLQKLKNFCMGTNFVELNYDTLVENGRKLWENINKRRASDEFYSLKQGAESINEYAVKLQSVAEDAGMRDEDTLTNKFISGIKDRTVKYELLSDENIKKFDVALHKARLLEQLIEKEEINKISYNQQQNSKNHNKPGASKQKSHQNKHQNNQDRSEKPKLAKNQCSYCKRHGHWKKDCRKLKQKPNSHSNSNQSANQLGQISWGEYETNHHNQH